MERAEDERNAFFSMLDKNAASYKVITADYVEHWRQMELTKIATTLARSGRPFRCRVDEELDMQKDAVTRTNDKVTEQAITIKVQSDQITQCNFGNEVAVTPHREGPSPGNYTNQPPPPTLSR